MENYNENGQAQETRPTSEPPRTNSARAWLLAARPRTLTGAAAPVLVGGACAAAWGAGMSAGAFALCLLFAFVMQVDANFVNDYFDFRKGTDRADRLGPERACAQGWITPRAMKGGIAATTVAGCLLGLPLVCFGGWWMLAVGALCVAGCILYTTHLSYRGWGDALVVVFFGVVPVFFTFWCMCGFGALLPSLRAGGAVAEAWSHWPSVVTLGLAMGFATDCLLMVNNYRDVDQDRVSGKRTFVVRFGREAGLRTYRWLGWLAALATVGLLVGEDKHGWAFLFVYLFFHDSVTRKMQCLSGRALNEVLGLTARNIFLFGALTALALLLG